MCVDERDERVEASKASLSEIEHHVDHDLLHARAESVVARHISLGASSSLRKRVLEQLVDLSGKCSGDLRCEPDGHTSGTSMVGR